jgi:hypothetical protein
MIKLKFIASNDEVTSDVEYLTPQIKEECEVFYNKSPIGVLTNAVMVTILCDFIEYTCDNYKHEESPHDRYMVYCVRKFLKERTPENRETLRAIKYTSSFSINMIGAICDYENIIKNPHFGSLASTLSHYAGVYKYDEMKRQGIYVLDFLNSGKNLFIPS